MKELDVLFERFFEEHGDSLSTGAWPQMEELLSQEDDVLFDWISGRNLPEDSNTRRLIEALTHAI